MAITRATNLAGLGTVFDALTDGGGLSISGISTFTDLNVTGVSTFETKILVGYSSVRENFSNASVAPALQLESTSRGGNILSLVRNQSSDTIGVGGELFLGRSGGTSLGSNTIVADDNWLGQITFSGADGSEFVEAASIRSYVDGTPAPDDMPGRLIFYTTSSGNSSPTERMRIDSSGRVGIGATPIYTLHVQSPANCIIAALAAPGDFSDIYLGDTTDPNNAFVRYDNTNKYMSFRVNDTEAMRINSAQELLIGYLTDNGSYKLQVNSQIFATSATVATSDGRYKENVATLGGSLDLIKALRPVSFTWKPQEDITRTDADGNEVLVREGHDFPEGTQVGFIAQEVQEVLEGKPWLGSVIKENVRPAVLDNEGNELAPEEQFYGIAEGNLIAVLTNALQEAVTEIESLKARVTALEP